MTRQGNQLLQALPFRAQVRELRREDGRDCLIIVDLALLTAFVRLLLVGSPLLEIEQPWRRATSVPSQLACAGVARLNRRYRLLNLRESTLERTEQGIRGTGEPALEDAHRQSRGRSVHLGCAIVRLFDVLRRLVVEMLLIEGEAKTERIRTPLRVDRRAGI